MLYRAGAHRGDRAEDKYRLFVDKPGFVILPLTPFVVSEYEVHYIKCYCAVFSE